MYEALIPLFPGGVPGGTELVVILLIAVLLFGANKIPKLARSTGQAMGEFQKGREQVEQELQELQEGATLDDDGNILDEDGNMIDEDGNRIEDDTSSTSSSAESTNGSSDSASSSSGSEASSTSTESTTNE